MAFLISWQEMVSIEDSEKRFYIPSKLFLNVILLKSVAYFIRYLLFAKQTFLAEVVLFLQHTFRI